MTAPRNSLKLGFASVSTLTTSDLYLHGASIFTRDVLLHFDLPQVAAAAADRRLTLVSPVDAMKNPVELPAVYETYRWTFDVYAKAGASDRFRNVRRDPDANPADQPPFFLPSAALHSESSGTDPKAWVCATCCAMTAARIERSWPSMVECANVLRVSLRENSKRVPIAVAGAAAIGGKIGVGLSRGAAKTGVHEAGEKYFTLAFSAPMGLGAGVGVGLAIPICPTIY